MHLTEETPITKQQNSDIEKSEFFKQAIDEVQSKLKSSSEIKAV